MEIFIQRKDVVKELRNFIPLIIHFKSEIISKALQRKQKFIKSHRSKPDSVDGRLLVPI
jgi:hypothetical protein